MNGDDHVTVCGSGTPMREILWGDDCADTIARILKPYFGARYLNVGTGADITIAELAETVT